jgi:hypothetical protein
MFQTLMWVSAAEVLNKNVMDESITDDCINMQALVHQTDSSCCTSAIGGRPLLMLSSRHQPFGAAATLHALMHKLLSCVSASPGENKTSTACKTSL